MDGYTDPKLLGAPYDPDVHGRIARLRALGLSNEPDPELDEFAARLAHLAGGPFAMVNFIGEHEQYFAGLYAPGPSVTGALEAARNSANAAVGRTMARDHGFCPHVVVRRKALPLDDVCAYPRFAGNPVVDKLGIRSYLGAPLLDRTGAPLGTICVVSTEATPWGRRGLELIKSMAAELVERIERRR